MGQNFPHSFLAAPFLGTSHRNQCYTNTALNILYHLLIFYIYVPIWKLRIHFKGYFNVLFLENPFAEWEVLLRKCLLSNVQLQLKCTSAGHIKINIQFSWHKTHLNKPHELGQTWMNPAVCSSLC